MASDRVQAFMDTQADPCEDINKFACGGFSKIHKLSDDDTQYGSHSLAIEETYKQGIVT